MARRSLLLLSLLVVNGCAIALPRSSPPRAKTVWAGVFTDEQAQRGEQSYDVHCRKCHGAEGDGGSATTITGEPFFERWGEDALSGLFRSVAGTMPRDAPASLPQQAYVDIIAYILQLNGYPTGPRELSAREVGTVLVTGRDGPGDVPNFQLVQVVGCLVEGVNGDWLVANSSEPVRTRDPQASRDLRQIDLTPLGNAVFSLIFPPSDPAEHRGRKVEVKGILIRTDSGSNLNVMSLQPLRSACPG